MSKTVSTCLFETNQVSNKPQENVFFHSLYRTETEFGDEFFRTAKSTSPIQICAIFSTQGPDTLAATLNIVLNKELTNIVAEAQKQPVLDFESFSNKVVNNLNIRVCNFIVSKGGTPLRTSMTMFILDGDILRVLHIGNTKAVLFRDNRIMALTEEHTVAHRYVQMNAITPEQEKTHPENETLTQYLGKMPQDGPVKPDKKVNLKLKDGDELFLMGIGISKAIPAQMRNMIIAKPMSTEEKAREIIVSAFNYGVKYGLSIFSMKIESTFLLPGDAVIAASAAASSELSVKSEDKEDSDFESFDDPFDDKSDSDITELAGSDTMTFDRSNVSEDEKDNTSEEDTNFNSRKKKKKSIIIEILIYLLVFALFAGIAFGVLLLVFKNKNLINNNEETEPTFTQQLISMYVVDEDTPVLYEPNEDSVQVGTVHRGDMVDVLEVGDIYSQIDSGNVIGYVLNTQLTHNADDVIDETEPVETETEATIIITATPTPRPTSSGGNGGIVVATTAGNNGSPSPTTTTTAANTTTTAATTASTTASETTVADTTESTTDGETTATTTAADTTTTTETTAAAPTESTTAAPVETTAAPAAPETPAEGDAA